MKKWFVLILFSVFLFQPAMADDLQEVDRLIRNTVDEVLKVIHDTGLTKTVKIERIMDVVSPVFDLPLMAKLALGRTHWPKLTDEQRNEYTDLFVKQLRSSYLGKVELVADETIEFDPPVMEKNRIYFTTRVKTKDEPIKLVYKLYKGKARWRVYDVEIEDVSIIKSYGLQYNQILQNGNAEDLIKSMQEKIEQNERDSAKQTGEK